MNEIPSETRAQGAAGDRSRRGSVVTAASVKRRTDILRALLEARNEGRLTYLKVDLRGVWMRWAGKADVKREYWSRAAQLIGMGSQKPEPWRARRAEYLARKRSL